MAKIIDIGADFSDVPAGRFPTDGPFNGEVFRQQFLVPAFRSNEDVEVILDNTEGFGSSFLEEAFGGLIRVEGFDKAQIKNRLRLIATKRRAQRYKRLVETYIDNALSNG
jgi:hypothetical protein